MSVKTILTPSNTANYLPWEITVEITKRSAVRLSRTAAQSVKPYKRTAPSPLFPDYVPRLQTVCPNAHRLTAKEPDFADLAVKKIFVTGEKVPNRVNSQEHPG